MGYKHMQSEKICKLQFRPLHRSVDTVVIKMRIVDAKKPQRRSMGRIGGLELYDRRTFDFSSSIRLYGYTKLSCKLSLEPSLSNYVLSNSSFIFSAPASIKSTKRKQAAPHKNVTRTMASTTAKRIDDQSPSLAEMITSITLVATR